MACRLRAEQGHGACGLSVEQKSWSLWIWDQSSSHESLWIFESLPDDRWGQAPHVHHDWPPSSPWQVSRCVFGSVFGQRCFFYFTRSFSCPPCFHTLVVGRKKGRTLLCITLSTNHAEPLELLAFTLKLSILFMKTFLVQFIWQAFLVKSKWWAVSLFEGGYNQGAQIRSNIIQWHVWNHQVVLPKMGRIT